MKRRIARRSGTGPSRTWVSLETNWAVSAVSATTATILMSLQAPTSLTSLTSDPPEDLTILRIVGEFGVTLSAVAIVWTLAVLVQDTDWTPSANFRLDADKRILWSRTYAGTGVVTAGTITWQPPGYMSAVTGTLLTNIDRAAVTIDISPKVKLEAGKALYLVAYEEAGAGIFTVGNSQTMRLLFQRSRRR